MQKQCRDNYAKMCKIVLSVIVFAFVCCLDATAQMFDADMFQVQSGDSKIQNQDAKKTPQKSVTNSSLRSAPRKSNNKAQKVSVREVQKTNTIDPNEKIYMYMRDFKISHNLNGIVSCNMRFYVYSTVNTTINNVSYRLKWPKMETALSFSNIEPKKAKYETYTLLGDGCYEMDAIPNIIVNRCRIKGLTQERCSSIIQWTK